jgi:hypothetical protein
MPRGFFISKTTGLLVKLEKVHRVKRVMCHIDFLYFKEYIFMPYG